MFLDKVGESIVLDLALALCLARRNDVIPRQSDGDLDP
jgi:hypothetical protein